MEQRCDGAARGAASWSPGDAKSDPLTCSSDPIPCRFPTSSQVDVCHLCSIGPKALVGDIPVLLGGVQPASVVASTPLRALHCRADKFAAHMERNARAKRGDRSHGLRGPQTPDTHQTTQLRHRGHGHTDSYQTGSVIGAPVTLPAPMGGLRNLGLPTYGVVGRRGAP